MDILSDKNMLIKVIDALKKEQSKRASKRAENNLKQLFADDELDSREKVFLVVSLIKLPPIPEDGKVTPMTIKSQIPHSFVDKFTNVLLITKNIKGHGKDNEPSLHHFKNKLRNHDALGLVSEIMPFNQLRSEYSDFESRRNLARQFDIVLCDRLVIGKAGIHLGKSFYSAKKRPLQINLEGKDLKESIEKCLSRSVLHLNLEGSCSTVQIGRMNQSSEDIADNILSTITTWKKLMPGGWINIRSINLKSGTSKSLPLLVTATLPKDVPKVVNPYALEDDVIAMDSVNTVGVENNTVQVTRSGDVELVPKSKKGRNKYFAQKREEEAATNPKYDPATNKIIKNNVIIKKKNKGLKVTKRWVQKPKRERYFKSEGTTTSAAEGKGQKRKRDFSKKISRNRTSKRSQINKSVKRSKTDFKRKKSAQRTTNTRKTKKRKVSKE